MTTTASLEQLQQEHDALTAQIDNARDEHLAKHGPALREETAAIVQLGEHRNRLQGADPAAIAKIDRRLAELDGARRPRVRPAHVQELLDRRRAVRKAIRAASVPVIDYSHKSDPDLIAIGHEAHQKMEHARAELAAANAERARREFAAAAKTRVDKLSPEEARAQLLELQARLRAG